MEAGRRAHVCEGCMGKCQSLQADGEFDVATGHDVLHRELLRPATGLSEVQSVLRERTRRELRWKAQLLNDSRILARSQLGHGLSLGARAHLCAETVRARLREALPRRSSLHWHGACVQPYS